MKNPILNLLAKVNEVLEAKFGPINEGMTKTTKTSHTVFFNTANPRVKICVQNNKDRRGNPTSVYVTVAVEEVDRHGMFFALGDRLHLDVEKFPEFKFHKELAAKLTRTAARTDIDSSTVLPFVYELTDLPYTL